MGAFRIDGATALVTGGSSGIGAAAARQLAGAGATVFLAGRDATRLTELADRIGGTAIIGDLTEPAGAADLAERVLTEAGRVDVLVNNAGQGWAGPLTGMTEPEIARMVALNLTAPILLTRAVLPGMLARGRGHLGFVGSIAGRLGVREEAVYSGTKAGLSVFADSLRHETAGHGIVVTELVPAVVDTAFFVRRGRPYDRRSPGRCRPHGPRPPCSPPCSPGAPRRTCPTGYACRWRSAPPSPTPTGPSPDGGAERTAPGAQLVERSARMDWVREFMVARTAVGSYPQWAMQLAHRESLPRP